MQKNITKKMLVSNLKYIAFGIVMAVSLSYAYAAWGLPTGTYTDPTGTPPPADNAATPLNVSALDQVKVAGDCTANSCGGLSLSGPFLAADNAQFDNQVFLHGIVGASSNGTFLPSSVVQFGGTDSAGNSVAQSITTSGGLSVASTLQGSTLVNDGESAETLCADKNGNIVFCAVADMCNNIAGVQTTVPDDDQQNANGSCTGKIKEFLAVIPYQKYADPSILVGDIVDGNLPVGPGSNSNNIAPPLADQIGFYNGNPNNVNEWQINEIPGVQPTNFSDNGSRLLDVGDAGSYKINISANGNVGIQGKFPGDLNFLGVDFYLKITSVGGAVQWVPLDNSQSSILAQTYVPVQRSRTDFGAEFGTPGDVFQYLPYQFNFTKTYQFNPGDTVDVYAFVFGYSNRASNFHSNDYNNFNYSIDATNTTFHIIETPSGA